MQKGTDSSSSRKSAKEDFEQILKVECYMERLRVQALHRLPSVLNDKYYERRPVHTEICLRKVVLLFLSWWESDSLKW